MATALDDLIDTPPDEPSALARWAERTVGRRPLRVAACLALALALWADVAREGWLPAETLPGPIDVAAAFLGGIQNGAYVEVLTSNVLALMAGLGLALFAGTAIGTLHAAHEAAGDALSGVVAGLLALPGVVWLPLALIWFGPDARAVVFVVAAGSVGPIAARVATRLRAASATGAPVGRWQALGGAMADGLAAGWPAAWPSLVAVALLVQFAPLGDLLQAGRRPDAAAAVVAAMALVAVVGLAVNRFLVVPLARRAAAPERAR